MSKRKKLYNLRLNISTDAQRINYIIKSTIFNYNNDRLETAVLGELAMELANRIKKNSEKIGILLGH